MFHLSVVFSVWLYLEYVQNMILDGMLHFMQNHVCCFPNFTKLPVHFIGSIAYYNENILRKAAESLGITVGNIIQKPIHALVDYHIKYLIPSSKN
jgi:hypothetical protein